MLYCQIVLLLIKDHMNLSVRASVGVGSNSIASNSKLNVRCVVRSKFAGVILNQALRTVLVCIYVCLSVCPYLYVLL